MVEGELVGEEGSRSGRCCTASSCTGGRRQRHEGLARRGRRSEEGSVIRSRVVELVNDTLGSIGISNLSEKEVLEAIDQGKSKGGSDRRHWVLVCTCHVMFILKTSSSENSHAKPCYF